VGVISLGSWQTWERMRFEDAVALVARAVSSGVNMKEHLDLLVESTAITVDDRGRLAERVALALTTKDADVALASARMVVEAVPQVEATKRATFARICRVVRDDCLICSTTSSLPVDTLAGFVSRRDRFLATHWLNPAFLMPIVEVSVGSKHPNQRSPRHSRCSGSRVKSLSRSLRHPATSSPGSRL
jgi:3-hydroxyacyl-CoA dehydrogenase